ncbi:flagellar basal-body MS-ring/collar protein FliF [Oscillospiraceae bacterium MB08-C2-2]|nr:flagellar basal-body MS-ring/collar protein FliF [Oscillospiraceae bacterium MB08-C2-2]
MKDRAVGLIDKTRSFWNSQTKKTRILILSSAAGIVLISIVLAVVLNVRSSKNVVLFDNLGNAEMAQVVAALQELQVTASLNGDGSAVSIPAEDELRVRMHLATAGIPKADGFDYSTFQRGMGLTATQLEKDQYKLFDLQDRLAATIETFDEVQKAVVTISLPQSSSFVLQEDRTPATASVKIQKKRGRILRSEQVYGILNIVKNAVPGLLEENISLVDEDGDMLTNLDRNFVDGFSQKLVLTEQVNNTIRNRILSFIQPAFGEGKMTVAVNSILDLDSKVTESNTYIPADPANPGNNPLDYVERSRETTGGGQLAAGVPGVEDNTDVPQYAAETGDLNADGYSATHDVMDYLVSSVRDQVVKEGYDITDMTVAVMVDSSLLADGQRDQIIDLVATAAGISREKVSVQPVRFKVEEPTGLVPILPDNVVARRILLGAIIFVILCSLLIIFFVTMARRRKKLLAAANQGDELEYYDDEGTPLIDLVDPEVEFDPIVMQETAEQKLKAQIKDLADTDPEIVAQLIRTWLANSK